MTAPRRQRRTSRTGPSLWRFAPTRRDLLRRRRGVLRELHEGRRRSRAAGDLSRVRALGTTGSPLSAESAALGRGTLRSRSAQPTCGGANISGGTDFAGAFIGGNRELPQVPGKMQCRFSAMRSKPGTSRASAVIGEVGELVCTKPIPSMPLYSGTTPARALHRQLLRTTPASGATATGSRSPRAAPASSTAAATRRSTAMACAWARARCIRAVEALPEVLDSMVVDLEYLGRES